MTHPNIIKMKEAFYNKNKETIFIVMELVDGVTLKRYIREATHITEMGGLQEDLCKLLFV